MKAPSFALLAIVVSGCANFGPLPANQDPATGLISVCNAFYDAVEASLVHDPSEAELKKIQRAEQSVDPLCSTDGVAPSGIDAAQALSVVEFFLTQVVTDKQGSEL